jgi:hypothetical protein
MAGRRESPEKHSHTVPGGRGYWLTEKLWAAAAQLPSKRVKLKDIREFDRDCWFGERHAPTIRDVAEHARRIDEADLSYPIILGSDGRLLDGGHRLAKAYLRGDIDVLAVQFEEDPEPDWVEVR